MTEEEHTESRIAMISIILENTVESEALNDILHEYRDYIIGRMGIPYREKGLYLISVAVDAPQNVTSALTGRLGRLKDVSVKTAYSKK
ncbi:MAG TPA: iron-only hydrogenase system regulator [Lachnospiraceae bacterium]|jgi:putative iron-only hydrogenase system regulator|nr:iron-only hydrogenase system regulator [Lachnospiraceae bacterium]